MIDKSAITMHPLSEYLTEYKELNVDNLYRPVAVGRYGIRTRESIYSKELAADYSKNRLIYKGTLTVGMGSMQMDIGILSDDVTYSVSPAYHTYQISGVDYDYLRYCLQCRNMDMFTRFMRRGSRQGKSIDLSRWIGYEIPIYPLEVQTEIVDRLDRVQAIISARQQELQKLDDLIKARFVKMFGDPRSNPFGFEKRMLKDTCKVITGNTPSRAIPEYYGDFVEWIKTDNIVSGLLNPTKAAESLSEKGLEAGRTVDSGAILMACIAGSIASIGRVCVTDRKVAFNQQINAVVPKQYDIFFLYSLIQMSKEYLVEDINMALKGILSKSKLEEKEFIVPPMELQEQFADFVKQVDKSKVIENNACRCLKYSLMPGLMAA